MPAKRFQIEVEDLRRRYVEDLEDVNHIAASYGCSVANVRRLLKRHGIRRGKVYITSGMSPVWNRGRKDPTAGRNRERASFMSPEHREKLANAKRGRTGPKANNWQGGLSRSNGNLYLERRRTVDGRRIYEHRYVAEQCLSRRLTMREHVHHVDRDRTNNAPENLIVLSAGDHNALHRFIGAMDVSKADQLTWLDKTGLNYEVCDA